MTDCTELFLRYRDMARTIWNVGFWPNPSLREWDCVAKYRIILDRLFEGMVMIALGLSGTLDQELELGSLNLFYLSPKKADAHLLIDKHLPSDPGHVYAPTTLLSGKFTCQFRFVSFFDWNPLELREFEFFKVIIERMDEQPSCVGHYALMNVRDCTVWFNEPEPNSVRDS